MTTAGKSGVKYFCPSLGALCSSGTPRFLDLPAALTAIEVLLQMANKSADDSSARCPGSFAHIMVYHIKQRCCSLKKKHLLSASFASTFGRFDALHFEKWLMIKIGHSSCKQRL